MWKFKQYWFNNWTLMASHNVFNKTFIYFQLNMHYSDEFENSLIYLLMYLCNQTFIYFQLNMHYSDEFENSLIIVTQVTFVNGTHQVLVSCKRIECRQLKPTWLDNYKSSPLSPMAKINHSILYLKLIRSVGLKCSCVVGKQTCQRGGQPAPVLMDFLLLLLQGNAHVS